MGGDHGKRDRSAGVGELSRANEGVRAQFQEYSKNPSSAPLLTGLIVTVTTTAGLPIDPAIATIVVLYLVKIGLNVFCEYTEPTP